MGIFHKQLEFLTEYNKIMNFLKKIFKSNKSIRLTKDNINKFPSFENLLNSGKIKFDNNGRLRYLHGAPVGDLILIKNGDTSTYKEIAEEYFDPESKKASEFIWPQ